ncbi:hypothetical protein K435DRAFT_833853 [Dendrothele bispora CBS 962.96]|uniref:Uncharacterized protein n=1 Tax=Dendrothele bispora (strain CBS 962.96) TaxID=1314807 RepID=A0A4S8MVN6_DENBC|nr:hypothetical protein K435DRAFT_833853 [Dendrothele bispora CBS 962.96]
MCPWPMPNQALACSRHHMKKVKVNTDRIDVNFVLLLYIAAYQLPKCILIAPPRRILGPIDKGFILYWSFISVRSKMVIPLCYSLAIDDILIKMFVHDAKEAKEADEDSPYRQQRSKYKDKEDHFTISRAHNDLDGITMGGSRTSNSLQSCYGRWKKKIVPQQRVLGIINRRYVCKPKCTTPDPRLTSRLSRLMD